MFFTKNINHKQYKQIAQTCHKPAKTSHDKAPKGGPWNHPDPVSLLSIYKTDKAQSFFFKNEQVLNNIYNPAKKYRQESSWEPPKCEMSISNPKQKTKI